MVPTKTLHDGIEIPQLGFGVWQVPEEETQATVEKAFETGYRHIDTAKIYGNEAGVGAAVAATGIDRDDLFITTKVWNSDQGYDPTLRAVEESLGRLGLDRLDLYLVHWPHEELLTETWSAMQKIQEQSLSRAIGVCNHRPGDLETLKEAGGVQPAINQVELHPYLQQRELRTWHEDNDVLTEAWSPLASGEIVDDPTIGGMAGRLGRSAGQVVLRWHIQVGNVVIPKSVTPSRIAENFDLFSFELSDEDMQEIGGMDHGRRTGPEPGSF